MKRSLVLVMATSLLLAAPLAGAGDEAADPESLELVSTLMKALHTEQAFDQQVQAVVMSQIQRQPEVVAYRDVLTDFYSKYVGFEGLREPLTRSYLENFSKKELKELVAFYESPVGQKSLSTLPAIAGATLEIGVKNASANNEELQRMVNEKAELLNME